MAGNRFFIITYGCQMNEHDSENIIGYLTKAGYEQVEREELADIFIVVSCMVRKSAEDRAYGKLNYLKKYKKERDVIIGCGGCISSYNAKELLEKIPHIDFSFTTQDIPSIVDIINKVRNGKKSYYDYKERGFIPDNRIYGSFNRVKAWISIMKGCNNFCSYCIVPFTRGREVSRRLDDILGEVRYLIKNGVKDITLLGQNVNSYIDPDGKGEFLDLLKEIDKISGDYWIRFMTSHPKDFNVELVDYIADSKHLCPHIHLPLQSGSNRILEAMNRKYDIKHYSNIINRIREKFPDINLTTDIIVGFPGETDDDFFLTLSALERFRFDGIFSFIYSDRTGTKAYNFKDKVSINDKKKRFDQLLELQAKITEDRLKRFIGKKTIVLVERESGRKDGQLFGHDFYNKVVVFEGSKDYIGKMVKVRIVNVGKWVLKGELIND